MRIPMGNFGSGDATAPVQHTRLDYSGMDAGASAIARAGQSITQIGDQLTATKNALRERDEALARAKAANALSKVELENDAAINELRQGVENGAMTLDEAKQRHDEHVQSREAPDITGLDPATAERVRGGFEQAGMRAKSAWSLIEEGVKQKQGMASMSEAEDLADKQLQLPGADVETIVERVRGFHRNARAFGVSEEAVAERSRTFEVKAYTRHAENALLSLRGDAQALDVLEANIRDPDGYYAGRLDNDHRTALLEQVAAAKDRLAARTETAIDKRETRAERAVAERNSSEATGIPFTVEKEIEFTEAVRGTSQEGALAASRARSAEIREVRAAPFAEQERYIADLRTKISNKPSNDPKGDLARVNALEASLESQRKMAQEDPLLFVQMRTGVPSEPLDLGGLASGNTEIVRAQLAERYDLLTAFQKRYGREITLNPWRPEEANQIKQAFAAVQDDSVKLGLVSALVEAAPTLEAAKATLSPISDEPALVLAAQAQYLGQKNGRGQSVGELILRGARVRETKAAPLPSDDALRERFERDVGAALPFASRDREEAWERYRLLYAGMADRVPAGDINREKGAVDDGLAKNVLSVATGGVVEHQGRKTVKPFGWSDDRFKDALLPAIRTHLAGQGDYIGTARGYAAEDLAELPLQQVSGHPGVYFVLDGERALLNPRTNKPYVLRLQ